MAGLAERREVTFAPDHPHDLACDGRHVTHAPLTQPFDYMHAGGLIGRAIAQIAESVASNCGRVDSVRVGSEIQAPEPTRDMAGLAERREVTFAPELIPAHVFE